MYLLFKKKKIHHWKMSETFLELNLPQMVLVLS